MFDLGKAEGTYFITMEFVPGQNLKGLIHQTGKLTIEAAISLTKQICEGLEEAHKHSVVHRDLKPSNIMIDADGNARIMDFGIARSLEAKGITGAGVMEASTTMRLKGFSRGREEKGRPINFFTTFLTNFPSLKSSDFLSRQKLRN